MLKKEKVKISQQNFNKIQHLKNLAKISSNPDEVKLIRYEINTIINQAKRKMQGM